MWARSVASPYRQTSWGDLNAYLEMTQDKQREYVKELDSEEKSRLSTANKLTARKENLREFISLAYLGIAMSRCMRSQLMDLKTIYEDLWLGVADDSNSSIHSMLSLCRGHRFRDTIDEDIDSIRDSEYLKYLVNMHEAGDSKYRYGRTQSFSYYNGDPKEWMEIDVPARDEEGLKQLAAWVKKAGFSKKFIEKISVLFDGGDEAVKNPYTAFFGVATGHPEGIINHLSMHNQICIPSEQSLMYYRSWFVPKDTPGKYRLIQTPNRRMKAIQRNIHARFATTEFEQDTLIAYHKGADYIKKLQTRRMAHSSLVTMDLRDWYHQVYSSRIREGIQAYMMIAGGERKISKEDLSRSFQQGETTMDHLIEHLQLFLSDLVNAFNRFPLRSIGKQLFRAILFDIMRTVIPQIVFLRRHRATHPSPNSEKWALAYMQLEELSALRELYLDNPELMYVPVSQKRIKGVHGQEKILTGKLINALGTLVPYAAAGELAEKDLPLKSIQGHLKIHTELPVATINAMRGEKGDTITVDEIRRATGLSLQDCGFNLIDLDVHNGPRVFALAQGSPTSGCLANFYFGRALLPGLRAALDQLKETLLEKYDLMIYCDNVGIFFTPKEGATHEIATRSVLKVCRDMFRREGVFVNDYKSQDFRGDVKKFLGVIIDDKGFVRVRREYLREVNQIIINLNKQETVQYKGHTYDRKDMEVLWGMIQWVKRTRRNSPYRRKLIRMNWKVAA